MEKSAKILIGAEEIKAYIGVSSAELFKKFMGAKLPVLTLDGRMYAHADNLDLYFQMLTKTQKVISNGEL